MPSYQIRPGSVAQVMATSKGTKVQVHDDVQGVANALLDVNTELQLWYDTNQALWIVEQHTPQPDGSVLESLVTTALDLDHRIVQRCREVCSPDYDLAGGLEKREAQAERDRDHARRESVGEAGEKLAHAFRKDLQMKSRAYIPPFRPKA